MAASELERIAGTLRKFAFPKKFAVELCAETELRQIDDGHRDRRQIRVRNQRGPLRRRLRDRCRELFVGERDRLRSSVRWSRRGCHELLLAGRKRGRRARRDSCASEEKEDHCKCNDL